MNLTEQQWDLLRLLVEKHQKHRGQSFIVTHANEGLGLTFTARDSAYVPYSYMDLQQLNCEGLVTLNEVGSNQLSGQLTELGIRLGRKDSSPTPESPGLSTKSGEPFPGAGSFSKRIAKGAMPTSNSAAFWRDLEARFRALPNPKAGLTAHFGEGRWYKFTGGPSDTAQARRLEELFRSLARIAAIAADIPNGGDAVDAWLDLLRTESPHFHRVEGTHDENGVQVADGESGWIENVVLASAEHCVTRESRAFELETATANAGIAEGAMPDQPASSYSPAQNGPTQSGAHSPLGRNPFPPEDSRYDQWQSASRLAAEEWERFYAHRLKGLPPESDHWKTHEEWSVTNQVKRFDIRADWMCALFVFGGSYNDADLFIQALHRLVEATLASARDCLPSGERTQFFLSGFKLQLLQRQHHWRAEALRLAREAEQNNNRAIGGGLPKQASATEPSEDEWALKAIAKGARALSQFWRERQAEFEKYQQQFPDLKAHWFVSGQKWWLQCGESSEGITNPSQQALDVFKAIARTIVAGWSDIRAEIASKPYPRVATTAEPWEVWLDFMRVRKWGFRVTWHPPCNEYEWDAGVKDGKALDAVRKELEYTVGDEGSGACQAL